MSEEIDYESLVGKEISVDGDSLDDLAKNLATKLKELSRELGIPLKQNSGSFEVCFYSTENFEDAKAYVFGTAENYEKAKKRTEDRIRIGRMIDPTRDYKQNNDKVELTLYPFSEFDFGIVGIGSNKEEAEDNAFNLNLKIQETKFKKQKHVKATFRYKFENVSVEDKERTIKEELEGIEIEEKYFEIFFNKDLKKMRNKSNGIIPPEQHKKLIQYFQHQGVIDDNFEIVKKALASFEARRFSEISGIDFNDLMIENYDLIRAGTYGLGVDALRQDGLVVPFFWQNLEARIRLTVENPDTDLRDLSLWNTWLDSNAGIIYKGGNSGKFKIVHNCLELINIDRDFNDYYLPVNYNDYVVDDINVFELDTDETRYDERLNYDEVINHKGWLALVQNNQGLLENYVKSVFDYLKEDYDREKAMRFWINQEPEAGELRALCVGNMSGNSGAGGYSLGMYARFLRVAHK